MSLTRFEKKLCKEAADRLGRRITARNLLSWSISKPWIESLKDEEKEDAIFLPALEVWCLVRKQNAQN